MILVNFRFEVGWGDTFINVYNCISLIKHIKEQTNKPIHFTINNRKNSNALNIVLDVEYFNNLCDCFEILNSQNSLDIVNGETVYQGRKFVRVFSLNNPDITNSIPGGYDVFIEPINVDNINSLHIPYEKFRYDMYSQRVSDYSFYKKDLYENAVNFLNCEFDSIYYRSTGAIYGFDGSSGEEKVNRFIEYLNRLDNTKKYFFCSNSAVVKKAVLDKTKLDIVLFRDLNNHHINHLPNGFSMLDEDAYFAVSEMLIMGQSKHIHYSGEQSYMSLFNFYPVCVKNVRITDIDKI